MIVEQSTSAEQANTKVASITEGDEKEKIKIFWKYLVTAVRVISKFA